MEREKISIDERGIVAFPISGIVWMTEYEIADLFQVFYSAITTNRKAIFKSGILRKEDVCKEVEVSKGYLELYNLEMVIALVFRINSYHTDIFRKWLLRKLYKSEIPERLILSIRNPVLN